MPIQAYLHPASKSDSRVAARHHLRLSVEARAGEGPASEVALSNISATGMLLESRVPLAPGDRITADLPHAGPVTAVVVWSQGHKYGCKFEKHISSAAISSARLQSEWLDDQATREARIEKTEDQALSHRMVILRCSACLLLVIYHVIGASAGDGLKVSQGWLRTFNDGLALVRMPLFGFVSGFVYALRPARPGATMSFLRGKSRRLLVPMIVVGGIYIATQHMVEGTNSKYSGVPFIWPVAHYWYVESLFLVMLLVGLADNARVMSGRKSWSIVFSAACLLYVAGPISMLFSFGGAVYILPFFLLGLGLKRFDWFPRLEVGRARLALVAAASVLLLSYDVTNIGRYTAHYLAASLSVCALLASMRWKTHLITSLAPYTYSIYLFHVFFTAGSRIVLTRAGLDHFGVLLFAGVVAGMAGPIVTHLALERSRIAAFLLLGRSLRR